MKRNLILTVAICLLLSSCSLKVETTPEKKDYKKASIVNEKGFVIINDADNFLPEEYLKKDPNLKKQNFIIPLPADISNPQIANLIEESRIITDHLGDVKEGLLEIKPISYLNLDNDHIALLVLLRNGLDETINNVKLQLKIPIEKAIVSFDISLDETYMTNLRSGDTTLIDLRYPLSNSPEELISQLREAAEEYGDNSIKAYRVFYTTNYDIIE